MLLVQSLVTVISTQSTKEGKGWSPPEVIHVHVPRASFSLTANGNGPHCWPAGLKRLSVPTLFTCPQDWHFTPRTLARPNRRSLTTSERRSGSPQLAQASNPLEITSRSTVLRPSQEMIGSPGVYKANKKKNKSNGNGLKSNPQDNLTPSHAQSFGMRTSGCCF